MQKQAGRDDLPVHNRARVKSDGSHLLDGFKLKEFDLAAAAVPLSLVESRKPDVRPGPELDHLSTGQRKSNERAQSDQQKDMPSLFEALHSFRIPAEQPRTAFLIRNADFS